MIPEERICKYCGKTFIANRTDNIFCPGNCGTKYHKEADIIVLNKNCEWCNKPFTTTDRRKIYCHRRCPSIKPD